MLTSRWVAITESVLDSPWRVLLLAVLVAPLSVAATGLWSLLVHFAFGFETVAPNSVEEALLGGIGALRIVSALVLAPIVENLLCLLWATWFGKWQAGRWWMKPACIAAIAAGFHAIIFWDIRPFAVFPGFFVISCFILYVKDRVLGYWASVLHHFCINAINLALALSMG